jgi:hypothetical protein
MSSAEIIATLPSFFPSYTKECKSVAEPFFDCFSKHAVKAVDEDADAGRRGLIKCLNEMKKYSDCMTAAEKKNPPKRMRVSQKFTCVVVLYRRQDIIRRAVQSLLIPTDSFELLIHVSSMP